VSLSALLVINYACSDLHRFKFKVRLKSDINIKVHLCVSFGVSDVEPRNVC
jgi:hypothetical protein